MTKIIKWQALQRATCNTSLEPELPEHQVYFMPYEISLPYQLDESISNAFCAMIYNFIQIIIVHSISKQSRT